LAAGTTSFELAQKSLASEQRKFELGAETNFFVLDAQTKLAQAELTCCRPRSITALRSPPLATPRVTSWVPIMFRSPNSPVDPKIDIPIGVLSSQLSKGMFGCAEVEFRGSRKQSSIWLEKPPQSWSKYRDQALRGR